MNYDIIHFEALGEEANHLEKETQILIQNNDLPNHFKSLITPLTIQEYLIQGGGNLPNIITTKTHSKLPTDYIEKGVKKSVITRSAGYDHFEHLSDKVNIASLREYCVDAVSQTVIKFLYCMCGFLNEYENNSKTFERNNTRSFVELNKNKIASVFGVGKIGKKTYEMLENNGLSVQAVDLRQKNLIDLENYKNIKFVTKEEAIENSDIIVNVMNLTKNKDSMAYNVNYFNEEYLNKAKKPLFFINVTRGDIAPESILLKLYKEKKILGLGLDVFSREVDLKDSLIKNKFENVIDKDILAAKEIIYSAFNRKENFYVQPHQGFNSDLAAISKAKESLNHVKYWFKNGEFEEQLPYY